MGANWAGELGANWRELANWGELGANWGQVLTINFCSLMVQKLKFKT